MIKINTIVSSICSIFSSKIAKMLIIKISTLIALIVWGLILWYDLPESISYISIIYGMAVQLWLICTICGIFKLFGKRCLFLYENQDDELTLNKDE
jgi:hypothetical protein